mmetsp:Transcript_14021/g.38315  ORF Transcript_14021/g.38315 Transcript_14021/m.38315 type:complete len:418 (-) Transcript_14021:177-1430(-)
MTEFRKANTAVEAVEKIVAELTSGAGESGSQAERMRFTEAQAFLAELAPSAEKMRRKCQARADLEKAKAELRERLPGSPEDVFKVAQELVDAGDEAAAALRPLLDRALELDGAATYGAKMVEKVQDLLARLDAAIARFEGELVPRLGDAVAAAASQDAARRAEAEREAAAAAALEAERAEAERRKPVEALLAANEDAARKQHEEREAEERKRREEEEAKRRAEAALAEELEALRRAEVEGEARLREIGPDAACCEALVGMLAAPVGPYRAVVEALQAMLAGIAAEPQDWKLRVIRLDNEGFQDRLGRRPGVWLFLRGLGFEPLERQTLPEGLGASIGLGPGPADERFIVLHEPDMFNDFERWKAWHERLTCISQFLQGLERLAFQRTAHLGAHGLDVAAHGVLSARDVQQRWEARRG